jgi:hypothetical protein
VEEIFQAWISKNTNFHHDGGRGHGKAGLQSAGIFRALEPHEA